MRLANYSRELADYIIYVIDVSGGDKIPRKGGPGISQSDLLIVNKVSSVLVFTSEMACVKLYHLPVSPDPWLVSYMTFWLVLTRPDRPRTVCWRIP